MPLTDKTAMLDTEFKRETEQVKVDDINTCDEEVETSFGVMTFPYKIKVVDKKGKVITNERTTKTVKPKSWTKKFYIKESDKTGSEFICYTRDHILLALVKIQSEKIGEDVPAKLDLRKLIGMTFDAVVVRPESGDPFIDWVATFEANSVTVPSLDDIRQASGKTKSATFGSEEKEDKESGDTTWGN